MFNKILKGLSNIATNVNNFISNQNTKPTKTIKDYQNDYKAAASRGDADAMQRANEGANAIRRSQGVKEQWATDHISSVRKQQQNKVIRPTSASKSNNNGLLGAINRVVDKVNNITSGGGRGVKIGDKTFYNTSDGMPDIDAETLDLLNGWYSGRTIGESGYGNYYNNRLDNLKSLYDRYAKAGYEGESNPMYDAIQSMNAENSTMNLANNVFNNWDTGLLDLYIGNKQKWSDADVTPEERQKYEKTNAILRKLYGMEEDNFTHNDLGELKADILFGDFLDYGLNKEDRNSIPDITTSSMKIDPKFKTARVMARDNRLFGYEPLGRIVGGNAEAMKEDNFNEMDNLIFSIRDGREYIPLNKQNTSSDVSSEIASQIDSIISSSGKGSTTPTKISNTVDIGDGVVYETNNGRFINYNGQMAEISEDDYVKMMTQILGF